MGSGGVRVAAPAAAWVGGGRLGAELRVEGGEVELGLAGGERRGGGGVGVGEFGGWGGEGVGEGHGGLARLQIRTISLLCPVINGYGAETTTNRPPDGADSRRRKR
jgi:hypothetical protein